MFTACNPFPGIFHITDEMGVSFTLVEGEDSALVFDAGYGTEDVIRNCFFGFSELVKPNVKKRSWMSI